MTAPVSAILTEATCNVSCWEAVQDICMCSCGGVNHGITKRGGNQPARTRSIQGTWYIFVKVVLGQNNAYREACRLSDRPSEVARQANARYKWVVQSASESQVNSWPELEAHKGKTFRKYTGPYIIWCRSDIDPVVQAAQDVATEVQRQQEMSMTNENVDIPTSNDMDTDDQTDIFTGLQSLKNPQEYLPGSKFTSWRPGQDTALEQIITGFRPVDEDTEPVRFVAMDAPTGSGKSLSAIALGMEFRGDGPVAILTNTKALQDQYTEDFSPTLLDFRGKSNYECPLLNFIDLDSSMPRPCGNVSKVIPPNDMFDNSREIVEMEFGAIQKNSSGQEPCPVRTCGRCPYYRAKSASQTDDAMYVTNYANYMGLLNNDRTFQAAGTLLLDEAHNLDDAVENYAELTLSTYNVKDIGAEMPPWYDQDNEDQRIPEWEEWTDILRGYRDQAQQKYNDFDSRRRSLTDDERKTFRMMENIIRKFSLLLDVKGGYHATWAPNLRPRARTNKYNGQGSWKFRPFYPGQMAAYLLYRGAERVVFMSATIERSQILQFGVDESELLYTETPSTFPVVNSRIFGGKTIQYTKPFTYRNEGNPDSIREWVRHLDTLLGRMEAKGHRTLIIVPAGRQVEYIGQHSSYSTEMVLHKNDFMGTKQDAIDEFRRRSGFCILVGAFDIAEGHSFDGEIVEATIFPKLWSPPDFNDPLNILRTKRDPLHNERRKARWFAQAVGRATRSATDINHILLMDYGTDNWMKNAKALLPACVKERFFNG